MPRSNNKNTSNKRSLAEMSNVNPEPSRWCKLKEDRTPIPFRRRKSARLANKRALSSTYVEIPLPVANGLGEHNGVVVSSNPYILLPPLTTNLPGAGRRHTLHAACVESYERLPANLVPEMFKTPLPQRTSPIVRALSEDFAPEMFKTPLPQRPSPIVKALPENFAPEMFKTHLPQRTSPIVRALPENLVPEMFKTPLPQRSTNTDESRVPSTEDYILPCGSLACLSQVVASMDEIDADSPFGYSWAGWSHNLSDATSIVSSAPPSPK